MKTMIARYPGKCRECDKPIVKGETINFYGRGQAAHTVCVDNSDHSGVEDRACGDAAYEEMCERMTNY